MAKKVKTQIKLQISERLPPIIALVANQTATKMPALKIGERYFAVWDAGDSILVADTPAPASSGLISGFMPESSAALTPTESLKKLAASNVAS